MYLSKGIREAFLRCPDLVMGEATQQSSMDPEIGRLVVEHGLATPEEVHDCFQKQLASERQGDQPTLVDLLVSDCIITKRQLNRLQSAVDEQEVEDQKPTQQVPGFQIIQKLGAGAMATVYLAKQLSLDRLVAMKFLPKKHTNNPEFVQRFYAEGRAAAKLNHPNIVGALDVGQAGDRHYFVMEYVKGKTVYDDISANKRYTEEEALDIAIQVARALEHAHNAGFIHRDVKPKNIMFTKDGVAKLADMGLARAVSDREAAEAEQGKAFGTPYYISPEQIRGSLDVDFRADIYGLGGTLYHMVTGQVPFDGPNPSAVMHQHLKARLTPPDHINPSLSAGIGEIIEVCMAKDRNQRYNNTAALLEDLEAVRHGEGPLQARKKFDLASLASIETGEETTESDPVAIGHASPSAGLLVFLVAGWGLSLILLVVLLVVFTSRG